MKTYISKMYLVVLGFAAVCQSACKKDYLDVEPPTQVSADQVWNDPALARAFVTEIYNGLNQGGFPEEMLSSASDESLFTHPTRGIDILNSSTINPTTLGWVNDAYGYNPLYSRIRACNITIEKLTGENGITDADVKDQLLGEAYFLRGFYYQQLLRFHGGVPLVLKSYKLDDDFNITRGTYAECVTAILADCDSAYSKLNGVTTEKGRANGLAALAMKSRVLLYAASDLHDIPTAKAKSQTISGYATPEYLGYVSGDRTARWNAAKAAALAVITAGTGYKLDLTAPVPAEEGQMNYKSLAMGGGSKAAGIDATAGEEIIFGRYFIDRSQLFFGRANGPNGYRNWAGNTPIGLLVDDYEMADGTAFSWNNAAQKAHPYVGRDPRFYATVLYDGSGWKPRELAVGNVDPANQIQTGEYDLMSGGSKINFRGLDTRGSSIENWNGSWTGYYMHKFIDPDPSIVDASAPQFVPWPFFRYTEAVMNYIEACIETDDLATATLWLNRIRFRSGMPAITATGKDALRETYRHERRIEMVYEEQRYHDTRRWMIAPQTLGRKTTYIRVTGRFKPGQTMSAPYHHDENVYDYTYTPYVENAQEDRKWDDKIYFRPFSRDEINRNNLLKQNPGY
ncbi:MAG: RagB/SusD family nutrient uptake outer membrane protein [Mucilaginibacter polytrichastri]|nr:RagB/SusD family nutrient uptake outer membrane protein [Mucilaginibacter polytrichastri]